MPERHRVGISADHFAALGLPLRAGRELTEQEVRANAPVVVVGEGMAQTLWPERDPVGQSLRVGRERRLVEVVGVAADARDMFSAGRFGRICIVRCGQVSTPTASR